MTLLKVKNVFKQYGAHLVLEAADLEINEGEIHSFPTRRSSDLYLNFYQVQKI